MLSLLLIVVAGIFKAFMDYCSDNLSSNAWWNKGASWVYKYKKPMEEQVNKPWYYFGLYKPKYKEVFPYSSTFLVSLTDGWHLFQMGFLTFLMLSVVFYWPLISLNNIYLSMFLDFVIYRITLGISFEIVYVILKKFKK